MKNLQQLSTDIENLQKGIAEAKIEHDVVLTTVDEKLKQIQELYKAVLEAVKAKSILDNLHKSIGDDNELRAQFKQIVQDLDGEVVVYSPSRINVIPSAINARIDWNETNGSESYYVYYGIPGSGVGYNRLPPVQVNAVTIPGLEPNTTYEVFVRAVKGGHLSPVGVKVEFRTQELPE